MMILWGSKFLTFSVRLMVLSLLVSCQERKNQHEEIDQHKNENLPIKSEDNTGNELLLEAKIIDLEKKLVRVIWKNVSDKPFRITLTKRFQEDAEQSIEWPYFSTEVKARYPAGFFDGFVSLKQDQANPLNKRLYLLDLLVKGDKILSEHPVPIDLAKSVYMEPGRQVDALFDLSSLFESIPSENIKSVSVWFSYRCNGGGRKNFGYIGEWWEGETYSNKIELFRLGVE